MEYILRYEKPASSWLEGLPIGNGRLACMVMNLENEDRLALNHERLWTSKYKNREIEPVSQHLSEVRGILKSGDFLEGTKLANKWFGGYDEEKEMDSYQPAGDIYVRFHDKKTFVNRSLDINKGIVKSRRRAEEGEITSEIIASCTDNKILYRICSESPIDTSVVLRRKEDSNARVCYYGDDNELLMVGNVGGTDFEVSVRVITDGIQEKNENVISINHATVIEITADIAVSEKTNNIIVSDFERGFAKHSEAFEKIMHRVELNISANDVRENTDVEIQKVREGNNSAYLSELYFHYGRYLMTSLSLCAELPGNLQGKWNEEIEPPWDSDYHLNVNFQMNYWGAEPCNYPEAMKAVFDYIELFYEDGKKTAKSLYGCRGIYISHCADVWCRCKDNTKGWTVWIGAAAWLAQHYWLHYRYNGDTEFLRTRAYPFFAEVAEFYEDYLVEDEEGIYQIIPSQSPENKFEGTGDFPVSIGISSAMDVQLAMDAFNYAIESANILGIDREKVEIWEKMRKKLPRLGIGSDGRLLEWDRECVELEPGHRHLSHLYGIYPSDLLMSKQYEKEYIAAKKSLYYRLNHGGGHTGWSRAWTSCMMARIGDSEGFYEHFSSLVKDFSTDSLLDLHPPGIFQIDGNLGAVAAMSEAIISCFDNKIYLLRALPKQWKNGYMKGIKVPGGHIVNVEWKDGIITSVTVVVGFDKKVQFGETEYCKEFEIVGEEGQIVNINETMFIK